MTVDELRVAEAQALLRSAMSDLRTLDAGGIVTGWPPEQKIERAIRLLGGTEKAYSAKSVISDRLTSPYNPAKQEGESE